MKETSLYNRQRAVQKTRTSQNYSTVEPGAKGYMYETLLLLRLREHCGTGVGDCKSQRTREFAVRLCLRGMSETHTHKVSSMCLCNCWLNKDNISRHAKCSFFFLNGQCSLYRAGPFETLLKRVGKQEHVDTLVDGLPSLP